MRDSSTDSSVQKSASLVKNGHFSDLTVRQHGCLVRGLNLSAVVTAISVR